MSSHLRTKILSAVTTIRERTAHQFHDDAVRAALDSLEEAMNIEPIEAEREAIAQMLLDRADALEAAGLLALASELVEMADRIIERGEISDEPKSAAGGA
jgi:hypothetical protein